MIFDCHVHGGNNNYIVWWKNIIETEKDFIGYLKRCGVDKAILLPGATGLRARTYEQMKKGNEEVLNTVKKYPKMFVPAMIVTPDCLNESLREMDYYRKVHNVCWLGEQCFYFTGYKYKSKEFKTILKKAADLDMVLQIHEDEDITFIPKEFPSLTVVIPHPGGGPDQINAKIKLAMKHKNVYLDLCGSGGDRLGNVEEMVDKIGDERVMYGSDFTVNEPGVIIARIQNSLLKRSSKEKLLSGNVIRLLKSKGVKV